MVDKELLKQNIEKLSYDRMIDIYYILIKRQEKFSRNSNGVFFEIYDMEDDTISLLQNYVCENIPHQTLQKSYDEMTTHNESIMNSISSKSNMDIESSALLSCPWSTFMHMSNNSSNCSSIDTNCIDIIENIQKQQQDITIDEVKNKTSAKNKKEKKVCNNESLSNINNTSDVTKEKQTTTFTLSDTLYNTVYNAIEYLHRIDISHQNNFINCIKKYAKKETKEQTACEHLSIE